jgi:hypothetical protein
MKQIKSATRYIVILARTYADGTEQDYKTVNALQARYAHSDYIIDGYFLVTEECIRGCEVDPDFGTGGLVGGLAVAC